MKKSIVELIHIDPSLATPVYKQIVQSICRNIETGILAKDDVLPSVNKISEQFSLARGSVFTAYNDLRASGIIDSIPGKGYFVSGTETRQSRRVFLLFSTCTPYNTVLFNAIRSSLPKNCTLHLYFHQHNIKSFETLIREQAGYYNTFIIMPVIHEHALNILSHLDPKRTFLLDTGFKEFKKEFSGVFQNFEKDIFSALTTNLHLVSKYKRLILVLPEGATKEISTGFNRFAKKAGIPAAVANWIDAGTMAKGDAFIIVDDDHLVDLITLSKASNWTLGKDVGVLSYNETNLKSVIADGISTLSTDFEAMGRGIVDMAMSGKREAVENPFKLIERKSF